MNTHTLASRTVIGAGAVVLLAGALPLFSVAPAGA